MRVSAWCGRVREPRAPVASFVAALPRFLLPACALFLASHPAQGLQTRRVVFVVIDGARATEFLEQPGHANTPRLWNDLRPGGYVSHTFYNLGVTQTASGHGTILTGTFQSLDNDDEPRPTMPTLWEYFRAATGASDASCYLATYKHKLRVMSYSSHPDYGAPDSARVHGPTWDDNDATEAWLQDAAANAPRVSMLALGRTDVMGHSGNWTGYNAAIRNADSLTASVWQWIESTPGWAGRTTLFVTNDHGRHTTSWTGHGDGCAGCRHLGLLAIGPDFVQGVEATGPNADLRDLAVTAALLLGVPAPLAEGRILWELFSDPAAVRDQAPQAPERGFLRISPRPASGEAIARWAGDADRPAPGGRLELFDVSGRLLWRRPLAPGELAPGIRVPRPEGRPRAGTAWLRLETTDGMVATDRVVWAR